MNITLTVQDMYISRPSIYNC